MELDPISMFNFTSECVIKMSEEGKRFKLREEKHLNVEVLKMCWSPTMDLLAMSNANGEVILNRLSWQRVWTLPSSSEGDLVGDLAWMPDGKSLAIGYKSGHIKICDVQKGDVIHNIHLYAEITSLCWLEQQSKEKEDVDKIEPYGVDRSADFLPSAETQKLIEGLSDDQSASDSTQPIKTLQAQKNLSFLLAGTNKGQVHIYAFGLFPTAVIPTEEQPQQVFVDSAIITPGLECISMIVHTIDEDSTVRYYAKTYKTGMLFERNAEIKLLASKHVLISAAQVEINATISSIQEAWEEILRQVDSKLIKFAEEKKNMSQQDTFINDFLDLLVFGHSSPELQAFLVEEFTEKGLRNLGFSIENLYSNLQKLVIRQLQRVSENLLSYLNDLYGMSQWQQKFGDLGLDPSLVHKAVVMAGAFNLGASELQQVIDTSRKNSKAFFRWLYTAILRLNNDQKETTDNSMTQNDVQFVADFLCENFRHLEESETPMDEKLPQPKFKLERVGQYLQQEDLTAPPQKQNNPWNYFLSSSTCQKESELLYPQIEGKSTLQLKEMMDEAISQAVIKPSHVISASMECVQSLFISSIDKADTEKPLNKVCQFCNPANNHLYIAYVTNPMPERVICLIRQYITHPHVLEASRIRVDAIDLELKLEDSDWPVSRERCKAYDFVDFTFYGEEELTVLIQEQTQDPTSLLLQIPVSELTTFDNVDASDFFDGYLDCPIYDVGYSLVQKAVNHQGSISCVEVAVCGTRTTCAVLLSSRRRIRLFLLEDIVDDDDDEDDDDEEEEESKAMFVCSSASSDTIEDKENIS